MFGFVANRPHGNTVAILAPKLIVSAENIGELWRVEHHNHARSLSLCGPGYPGTLDQASPELKKDLPASSSIGLRLKAWVTVLDKNHIFILENIPFLIFQDDKGDILGGKNLFRKWEHTVV